MPRKPRLFLPGYPQHIVVRGHNRDPVMARVEDFRFMYRCLDEAMVKQSVAVHAWVLMHNHLHLLLTPPDAQSLPLAMQSVGRRYAQYFNHSYHRSGSLWEGRYKSALVDSDNYLLSCYRYIELNPVRAGLVRRPHDYPYSSFTGNALGEQDALITPHALFGNLIQQGGREAYVELCLQALDRKTLTLIRRGTQQGMSIGQAEFTLRVARLLGQC
jgi:putative transposase